MCVCGAFQSFAKLSCLNSIVTSKIFEKEIIIENVISLSTLLYIQFIHIYIARQTFEIKPYKV